MYKQNNDAHFLYFCISVKTETILKKTIYKKMKKYSLLLVGLMLTLVSFSQKAVIDFEVKTYDFGKINEEDGKATYVFTFTNRGNSPLVLNRVQASCGCTTPTYTKEPIEPGKKGNITVTYNPAGRPGVFTKTITVYSNASEEQATLIIKGEVIPKVSSDNVALPVVMGDLRLKAKIVQMNNVDKGKTQTRVVEIQNAGKGNLKPVIDNLPQYISVSVVPETLKPNEEGKITFTFNSKLCNQWGPVTDEVYVTLNGQKKYSDEFQLRIVENIVEDFSKLTLDQKRNAPILETASRTIDFGVIKAGAKKVAKYKISNKGVNPLEVRRIINNNNEIYVHQTKMSVARGKSNFLIIDLFTKTLPEGDYKKSFTVQTNDPDNPFIILVMTWKVKK